MSFPENMRILNPGPVGVPKFVLEAISKPVIHQRSAPFWHFFADFQSDLRYVFQTEYPVIAMPGTGTFGLECAIFSLFKAGGKIAIPAIGKFSQRWVAFAMQLGIEVIPLGLTWGHAFTVAHVEEVLEEYPDLAGWVLTHVETSTGVAIDLEEIAALIKAKNSAQLIVVDAICSLGIQALYTDAWQLDAVIAASHKSFLNPAGTVYVAVGPHAIQKLEYPESADYRDLGHYFRYLQQGSYPFTPPVQMFFGVSAALKRIREKTLPVIWNETHAMSRFFKAEIEAMGGAIFGTGNADSLTVFSFGRHNHDEIREALIMDYGIETAGGQDQLEGIVIRVGHFGDVEMRDMQNCISALKTITKSLPK